MSTKQDTPGRGANATHSIARAEQIFRDELRSGCLNRLVQGGLEGFVRHWLGRLREQQPEAALLSRAERAAAELSGYDRLAQNQRRSALQSALAGLQVHQEPTNPGGRSVVEADRPGPVDGSRAVPRARDGTKANAASPSRQSAGGLGPAPRLGAPLEQIGGVGPVRARALARLGLNVYYDLLQHYPNRHESYPPPRPASELLFMQKASYEGVVKDVQTTALRPGLRKLTARLADSTGQVTVTFLRAGFSGPKLTPGQRIAVSGSVVAFGRQIIFENPDWEPASVEPTHTRRMVPMYPLTGGVHQYWLRSLIAQAVRAAAPGLPDHLPEGVRSSLGLPALNWAMAQIHFPDDPKYLEAARQRLAFDELLLIQLLVQQRRLRWQEKSGRALEVPEKGLRILLEAQPFELTAAQGRVLEEINADLARPVPMSRLLQGEVGSGKTAVAAAALFMAVANGSQGVMMAPTEILAEQHFATLRDFYAAAADGLAAAGHPVPRVEVLTGSASRKRKEQVYRQVADGEIDILVGTHAVIQEGVEPRDLALSIVDEQHRFGVRQRIELRGKGRNPHLLVMTATPIPRTLALSLHGDLDISMIDELPPGREKIETRLLLPLERPQAYELVRREAANGRQSFIICPLVEGSSNVEARAATEEYERLRKGELVGLRLALLHGRLRAAVKDDVMRRFRDREFDVLVSTSVVEVGVDVPNATVMLVEGAERFGLAQLHQFRGRVGRGHDRATCLLLSDTESPEAVERLVTVARSDNGLELAEYDLRQRGPGDFFGVRQSGLPELRVASLDDIGLVEKARQAAAGLLAKDSDLAAPELALLAARLSAFVQMSGEPN